MSRAAAGLGVSWHTANTAILAEGRSKAVFTQWLAARPKEWSQRIEVVAMDGFSGFQTAAADVLAFFDRPGTSNGPTEAINGRLEHLRGSALGFRNLTNYIARSLLETGGFRPQLHP
ncbi:transposase [Microbacterium amylolyticum]|uniref:Transposase n=1 Tax=Microbacterium amylolyticum TaxID=936337 RepID=A0ABS4ZFZ2_9MICO|nr:transposase [Microbacterium amylolyticum]